jgi:hypothetical protein
MRKTTRTSLRLLALAPLVAATLLAAPLAASATTAHHVNPSTSARVTCSDYGDMVALNGVGGLWDGNQTQNGAVIMTNEHGFTNYCPVSTGGGWYELVQYGTNWCLALNASLGNILVVQTCNGGSWQQWNFADQSCSAGFCSYAFPTRYNDNVITAALVNSDVPVSPFHGYGSQYWIW